MEMIHMPSRFYKIYANKVREMPSLKTDDIRGAKPSKFNYAKSELLQEYHSRSQPQIKKETNVLNYWGAISPPVEEYQVPKSIHQTSYIPYKSEDYHFKGVKGTPSLFLPERPSMHTDRGHQSKQPIEYGNARGYQYANNIQNSQASDYNSAPQYASLSSREPQPRVQVRDSLDALQYEYQKRDQNSRQNLQYNNEQQEQNDFRQKYINMYGVEPSEHLVNSRNVVKDNRSLEQDYNTYKSPSVPAIHDTRSYNYGIQNNNKGNEQFEKNRVAFFGADEAAPVQQTRPSQPTQPSQPSQQAYYDQYQERQYYSNPYVNRSNPNPQQYGPGPVMRTNERLVKYL